MHRYVAIFFMKRLPARVFIDLVSLDLVSQLSNLVKKLEWSIGCPKPLVIPVKETHVFIHVCIEQCNGLDY
jgi:hypothetical protein